MMQLAMNEGAGVCGNPNWGFAKTLTRVSDARVDSTALTSNSSSRLAGHIIHLNMEEDVQLVDYSTDSLSKDRIFVNPKVHSSLDSDHVPVSILEEEVNIGFIPKYYGSDPVRSHSLVNIPRDRAYNSSLNVGWGKKTHTDRSLHAHSHHHPTQKSVVLKTLVPSHLNLSSSIP
jgi:hypothetical protein